MTSSVTEFQIMIVKATDYAVISDKASVFSEIFKPETQIAIWSDQMCRMAQHYAESFKDLHPHFSIKQMLTPDSMPQYLDSVLKSGQGRAELIQSVSTLAEMFCYLFEQESLGFRMHLLDRAMCPRFHRDYVPCRLVMTLRGASTHWLDEESASLALSEDSYDGAFNSLDAGDIALLKGAGWFGNEAKGLVHRSPSIDQGDWRLFLSMDFAN